MMNEFDVIEKYFAPLAGAAKLDNDAAVLTPPQGMQLVVTSDTLNAGRHFVADADPLFIATKALRVNVSDLLAMGAKPAAYQLNIAFSGPPEDCWLSAFTAALKEEQERFGMFCSGGDTTIIDGPLSLSITAMGWVPEGQALPRAGAQENDLVLQSGPVGDAWIGLQILKGKIKTDEDDYFTERYYRPVLCPELTDKMRGFAHAAIDVSDGLIADLAHICKGSNLSARLNMSDIMLSGPAQKLRDQGVVATEELVTGGDDYVLLLAIPENAVRYFPDCTVIGSFTKGRGVQVLDDEGREVAFSHTGWSHF